MNLRSAVAWGVSASKGYYAAQWALGRVAGGFILAYHDLDAARFVEQIEALAPNQPIRLSELIERYRAGKPTAGLYAITFDDGVATTVRGITSACRERGWPVTFYLPTGYLDDGAMPFQKLRAVERHLPADEIRSLERAMRTTERSTYEPVVAGHVENLMASGAITSMVTPEPISWAEVTALSREDLLEFQSHGVSHSAVSGLDDDALDRELRASQERIVAYTSRPCRHFCYPYGSPESIGPRAPAIVAKYYDSATTLLRGRLRRRAATLLPRIPIYAQDDPDVVRLKILTA